jgi:hypothetical protein
MDGFEQGFRNAQLLPDYVGSFQRAYDEGRKRKMDDNMRNLTAAYYGGKVAEEHMNDFLGDVARNGGDPRLFQEDMQAGKARLRGELGRGASFVLAASTPEARAQAYATLRPRLEPITREYGVQLPEAWSEDLMGEVQQIASMFGGSGAADYKPMNVSPGGEVVDPRSGRVIHANQNFAPQRPTWDSNRGGWAMPPDQGRNGLASLGSGQPQGGLQGLAALAGGQQPQSGSMPQQPDQGGGFMQVAPPRPNYEEERLRIAQEANQRAAQAANDAAEARRRSGFGTAPAGQRFRQDGVLEDIPGYRPQATANADATKTSAQQSALAQDAYAYAAADTGVDAAVLRQMKPEQVRDLISGKAVEHGGKRYNRQSRWATGPIAGRIPGMGYLANADLEAYRNASAGKQARINNPTGPVTNADFDIGAKSVWGPDKPDSVNAQLVYDALARMAAQGASVAPAGPAAPQRQQKAKEGDVIENDQGIRLQLRAGQWVRVK